MQLSPVKVSKGDEFCITKMYKPDHVQQRESQHVKYYLILMTTIGSETYWCLETFLKTLMNDVNITNCVTNKNYFIKYLFIILRRDKENSFKIISVTNVSVKITKVIFADIKLVLQLLRLN